MGTAVLHLGKEEYRALNELVEGDEDFEAAFRRARKDGETRRVSLNTEQLDGLYIGVGNALDESSSKKEKLLWDGLFDQIGDALEEAALASDDGE